ncbi:ATP-binding cassette domain-containing protein [Caulobacter segnis]|uniref:amino acid ABC transporter ATP-binding/permease protein n=1 Tax=Caulobacter segnis TaxID=88688 RepID=UPI0024102156|nr:ATP-binding cassette domain-containing protein [Caulobacter segnis]MDG2520250.1 ATP-binding cassette domain-containing protein [Caulobacter segnis]
MKTALDQLIAGERRRQAGRLWFAGLSAVIAAVAAVVLLGISGWFITAAALAGVAGPAASHTFNFLLPSAMIRLLAILRTAFRYLERLQGHQAALGALAAIRPRLFASLAASPPRTALRYSAGEVSARFIQDVDAIEGMFIRLSAHAGAVASLIAGLILTAFAGWRAAFALALFAGLAAGWAWWTNRRAMAAPAAEVRQAVGRLKDVVAHMAASAPELRCYGLEKWAADRVAAEDERQAHSRLGLARVLGASAVIQAALTGLAAASVLLVARNASPPVAALAVLAAAMTMEGVQALVKSLEQDSDARAAAARLEPVLSHAPSPLTHLRLTAPSIELSEARVRLKAGERLGVSGPSGVGKTTLLEQLMAMRSAPRGAIRLGDLEVADLDPQLLRASFAYAGQEPVLLTGTVRENLRLAAPKADDAALWSALFAAGLDERVRRMPSGLDTWLGEGAGQLSGGERRRLTLARALLRPADWLLLDEPTEGLDAATEALVLERLDHRLAASGQGLIVVSHRPAPLALCGQVLAVKGLAEDGRVLFAARVPEHQA